jgi:preprotein translocase subunit SecF
MKGYLLHIVLVIFSFTTYGQEWQIKFDGGYSIPVSRYARVDVSQTISIIDGDPVAEYSFHMRSTTVLVWPDRWLPSTSIQTPQLLFRPLIP